MSASDFRSFVSFSHAVMRVLRRWRAPAMILLCVAGMLSASGGCRSVYTARSRQIPLPATLEDVRAPSNERDWIPEQAIMPTAEWNGSQVTVRNVRNFEFVTEHDFIPRYYDKTYQLDDLESVDFIVAPFKDTPVLAHTMISFGFGHGEFLVSSVEARLEKGESYSPLAGAWRQFEIMYVLADERDVIQLRTEHRDTDVYVYRAQATREQVRALLLDVLNRVNKLAKEPEFYDTIYNNCTTNIAQHINDLKPGRIPYDYHVLLPGFSPKFAYDLGLLDKSVPFEELTRRAHINDLAHRYRTSADFSTKIRR